MLASVTRPAADGVGAMTSRAAGRWYPSRAVRAYSVPLGAPGPRIPGTALWCADRSEDLH